MLLCTPSSSLFLLFAALYTRLCIPDFYIADSCYPPLLLLERVFATPNPPCLTSLPGMFSTRKARGYDCVLLTELFSLYSIAIVNSDKVRIEYPAKRHMFAQYMPRSSLAHTRFSWSLVQTEGTQSP